MSSQMNSQMDTLSVNTTEQLDLSSLNLDVPVLTRQRADAVASTNTDPESLQDIRLTGADSRLTIYSNTEQQTEQNRRPRNLWICILERIHRVIYLLFFVSQFIIYIYFLITEISIYSILISIFGYLRILVILLAFFVTDEDNSPKVFIVDFFRYSFGFYQGLVGMAYF